ncbi:3-oxoacyl-[acyl-carrier protein] reductase [Nocardioides luteus]|uniref:Beta-ketoacyl-ACP reductase n=1 Tax=Nocardioides luteus TaxID=1844 RepID=A0ABQ5SZ53_9ACTN|nr:SDR family oxidoreductase [Nocardioides luteus]MDR7310760.1 3-oxoacyl-[acyl-carrier protein] reductase [Nocardioides luteus]GGR40778.1 beta-ketoacyl-ACP reductase [Nocardioides luteus]GLJ69460.1 beta-ketoacyl-ACP reductase [Nocardioides luteus]
MTTTSTSETSNPHSTGRVVVITGAAGGMGAALTKRFLDNGDRVIATDRSADALDETAADLDAGGDLVTVAGSIADEDDVGRLADAARAASGVDVLLNVAGFFPFDAFAEMTAERWRTVIDINLTGYFLVTRALLPLMSARGWGRIVNVGSASMYPGVAGQVHYVTAKSGLVGFTRSLAREVGGGGITVNLLTPGVTLTGPVLEHFPPELIESQRESRAIPRDQHAEDLVGPIFFLASPEADFITGQTLNVDGGMFMN